MTVGKEIGACPYYATRYAVPEAQVCSTPTSLINLIIIIMIFH